MPHVDHIAHLYLDEPAMAKVVGEWVAPAIRRGAGAVMICTAQHATMVGAELADLAVQIAEPLASGRFAVVDAAELLSRCMIDGSPSPIECRRAIGSTLDAVDAATGGRPVRAWGEMVDILVKRGQPEAARELEAIWNTILAERDVQLLCSYELGTLEPAVRVRLQTDVHAEHSEVVAQTLP